MAAVAAAVCCAAVVRATGWNTTWVGISGHVLFTVIFTGMATWAARLRDRHFKEHRVLRTNYLRMPASLVWMGR